MRARRTGFSGPSLLICAALAFIFMGGDESRQPGSPPSSTLEVAPAQAMAPVPRRPLPLPSDRIMAASLEIVGQGQAPDIWSTPLARDESAAPEEPLPQPTAAAVVEIPAAPSVVFEQASLFDQGGLLDLGERPPAVPAVTASLQPLTMRSLAGRWASHPAACSDRGKGGAYLPLTLDERGARAGGASCSFRRTEQDGSRWTVAASCRSGEESWNANIRLALAGNNKLTWSSERGTQTYTRCR